MRPAEFWSLTPAEFNRLSRGLEARDRADMEKLAWLAHIVIRPHVRHTITPRELLGDEPGQLTTVAEKTAAVEKMKKKLERQKRRRKGQKAKDGQDPVGKPAEDAATSGDGRQT